MTKEQKVLLTTAAMFTVAVIYGGVRQEKIKSDQRHYDNQRTALAVGKVNAKQDVARELLMALYRETGEDTTGLKAFDREYMDSLEALVVLPK